MWMEIESFVKVAELLSSVTIFISSEYGTNLQHPPSITHPILSYTTAATRNVSFYLYGNVRIKLKITQFSLVVILYVRRQENYFKFPN